MAKEKKVKITDYKPSKIESKWQKIWDKKKAFIAKEPKTGKASSIKKFYGLIEFPYPSGDGLHVGHIRSNTAMDIISRKRRMEGYNVLYPIGWDAFGLPTENYAIKTGIAPEKVTKRNTDIFRKQLKSVGFSFDWSREINTTDPKYFKWTQWIFLQFLKNDLAYKAKININWCPKDKIGLANEEVIDGKCERCGTPVERREKEQWMLAITKYADRLDKDLDDVDYLEKIKLQQRNWIGKSEGAEISFRLISSGKHSVASIQVFTTRPDTIFGATYIVLAPETAERFMIQDLGFKNGIQNTDKVVKYMNESRKKSELERVGDAKEKTGVELKGVKVINPANQQEIPVFMADYVLATYGTGAVMAVPAHDERDFEFAKKYNLEIKEVISGGNIPKEAYVEDGVMVNSAQFNGKNSAEIKKEITKFVNGKWVTKFKLRDWVFSRQRYWGEPIPVIYCSKCLEKSKIKSQNGKLEEGKDFVKIDGVPHAIIPIPDKDLPLKLPKVKNYQPTDTGESPLASISNWVNTKCPVCGGKAKRETDTMPNWAGSSWYFLRYADPKNSKKFADPKNLKYFTPVDWYNGGMEHTTLHLLYSRFWHKFLYDLKLVPSSEPYKKRTSHGMILAENGEKMSKSRGNVINPDDIVRTYGADTLRVYEMFMGPFDQSISWDTNSISGSYRFLERIWKLQTKIQDSRFKIQDKKFENILHKTIKKVGEDIEDMKFNTAISSMMILLNEMEKVASSSQHLVARKDFEMFLKILSPFAPHITEEIWSNLGNKKLLSLGKWPKADPKKIVEEEVKIVIQINGKVRDQMAVKAGLSQQEAENMAKFRPDVEKWLSGGEVVKVIYVPNKILNFVVKGL